MSSPADLLVKLYELPPLDPALAAAESAGFHVHRARAPEAFLVVDWVREKFGELWVSETQSALSRSPAACFIAVAKEPAAQLTGFACYNAAFQGLFGPTGVDETCRGRGLGRALLLSCLHAMAAQGFAYAVIGAASSHGFYKHTVGAVPIPDSWPGAYAGLLRPKDSC